MINRLLVLIFVLSLTACGSEEDNSEPPAELTPFEEAAKVTELWSVSTGEGVEQQFLKLYPLLLDDRIIVVNREGDLSAIDLDNGQEIWQLELDVAISAGVGGDAQHHLVSTTDGEVILVTSDGAVKWRVNVSREILMPPVIADGKVIIRSVDGQIAALDLASGAESWMIKREVPALSLRGNSSPVVNDGRIYSGMDSGHLVAINLKDGRTIFDATVALPKGRSELERLVDVDGDIVLDSNVLYVGSYQGRIVAIDVRRGQLLWARKLSSYSGVAVSESSVFSVDEQDFIWALDKNTGATLWKQEKLKARQLTKPVTMEDTIVVADYEGYLHWISQYDGRFIARTQDDSTGIIVPPIVKGDRVYLINREGRLTAYQYKNN